MGVVEFRNRPTNAVIPAGTALAVWVREGEHVRIVDIEGDEDSPVSRGRLCPKGAATFQFVTGSHRVHEVLYRRPGGTRWEKIPLQTGMRMVASSWVNVSVA